MPEEQTETTSSSSASDDKPKRPRKHKAATGKKHVYHDHPDEYARWDRAMAGPGDKVTMIVELPDLPGEKEGKITVWERDADGNDDKAEENITVKLVNGSGSKEWTMRYVDDSDDIPEHELIEFTDDQESEKPEEPEKDFYKAPEFYFKVTCDGKEGLSPILKYGETIRMRVVDENGDKVDDAECLLIFSDGTEIKGRVKDGVLQVEQAPPLSFMLYVDGYTDLPERASGGNS